MSQSEIKAVSYSRISTWRWCPAQLRFSVLMGLKQPSTPAMDEGNRVHSVLERYVKALGKVAPRLPPGLSHLAPELKLVRADPGRRAESQHAFTAKWKPTEYFAPDTFWRMKIDLRHSPAPGVLRLTDYKTGKVKPEKDEEQLGLYTLTELLTNPAPPPMIETALWYTSHEEVPRIMHVHKAPYAKLTKKLKDHWTAAARQVVSDTQLAPTPADYKCRNCHYSGKRGGPCKAATA